MELKKIDEKVFFKYKACRTVKDIEWTKDCLKNKYYYFSQPHQLNDPFDCQLKVSLNASKRIIKKWLCKNNKNSDKQLSVEDVQRLVNNSETLFQSYLKDNQTIRSMFHILSLTDKDKDEVMWSLYANYNSGLTIGYKTSLFNIDRKHYALPLKQISVDPNKLLLEGFIFTFGDRQYTYLKKVKYGIDNKHIFSPYSDNKKNYIYSIFHKKENWKTESEFRALLSSANPKDNIKDLRVFYPDDVLAEITFGEKMDKSLMKDFYELVTTSYSTTVKFFIAKVDYENFIIKKIPYEPEK